MTNVSIPTNLLVDAIVQRFGSASPTYGIPARIKVGIGDETPSVTATDLATPAPITYTAVDDCNATTGWSATTDGSVALNTTSGEFIEGTGGLNLVKSGTTQTSVTFSKTTTSRNFTSQTLWSWLYINSTTYALLGAGTAVEIRFGSDSSNYYYKQYTAAALASGVNWLYFTSATATGTTGTPTITACDYYAVIITVNATSVTYTSNSVRLDHLQIAGATDYYMDLDSAPAVDLTGDKVTSQATMNLVKAIGQNLNNAMIQDSSGNAYTFDQFTTDNKTKDEEWRFTDEIAVITTL